MKKLNRALYLISLAFCFILVGCNSNNQFNVGLDSSVSSDTEISDFDINSIDFEEELIKGRNIEQGQGIILDTPLNIDYAELETLGTVEDDGVSWEVKVMIPTVLEISDPSVFKLHTEINAKTEKDYFDYLLSIREVHETLDWRVGKDISSFYVDEPIFLETGIGPEHIMTYWNGFRSDDLGNEIASVGQEASFYFSRELGQGRVNAILWMVLNPDETVENIDVNYCAEFFSSVVGRKIDPSILMSILKYGESHMLGQSELIVYSQERGISVLLGNDDSDGTYIGFNLCINANDCMEISLSAATYAFFNLI